MATTDGLLSIPTGGGRRYIVKLVSRPFQLNFWPTRVHIDGLTSTEMIVNY